MTDKNDPQVYLLVHVIYAFEASKNIPARQILLSYQISRSSRET